MTRFRSVAAVLATLPFLFAGGCASVEDDVPPFLAAPQAMPARPALPLVASLSEGEWAQAVEATRASAMPLGYSVMPSPLDIERTYPRQALQDGIEGRVLFGCRVEDTEGRLACLVLSSDVTGMGFEDAGRRVLSGVRVATTDAGGQSAVGRAVKIPIRFAIME